MTSEQYQVWDDFLHLFYIQKQDAFLKGRMSMRATKNTSLRSCAMNNNVCKSTQLLLRATENFLILLSVFKHEELTELNLFCKFIN